MAYIKLEGDAYYLSTLSPEDVSAKYLGWMNDKETTRFLALPDGEITLSDLQEWVAGFDNINNFVFGIYDFNNNAHIGNVTLYNINREALSIHYGCMIGEKDYWGRGAVAGVLPLLFDFSFEKLGMRTITAGTDKRNVSTIVNFRKHGFKKTGEVTIVTEKNPDPHPAVTYILEYVDWQQWKRNRNISTI